MRVLIAAAGRTGFSLHAAVRLCSLIEGAQAVDLCLSSPDPAAYDGVIVGGSVRMGRLHRKAREFLTLHQKTLLERPLCCFVCCAFADRAQEYLDKEVPPALLDHAEAALWLGGQAPRPGESGIDRFLSASINRELAHLETPPAFDPGAARQLADAMRAALERGGRGI